MSAIKLLVAVPSGGMWYADFALSLIGALSYCRSHMRSDSLVQLANTKGSILPKQRMELVDTALKSGMTHILFLDTDHTFPADMIMRLLSHKVDVVAANCATKTIPANPTARKRAPDGDVYGEFVFSDPDVHGLEEVWRVGTGIMLVHTGVFRNISSHVFKMFFREDVQTYQGEDWSMCEAMEEAGYKIFVDHDVSRQIGHIGLYTYTHDVIGGFTHKGGANA